MLNTLIGELTPNPRSGFSFYKPSASADGGHGPPKPPSVETDGYAC